MSIEVDLLLTDEYQEFSKKIAEFFAYKKNLDEDFKKQFEEYKLKKAEIEKSVQTANQEWENWKKSQLGSEKKQKTD